LVSNYVPGATVTFTLGNVCDPEQMLRVAAIAERMEEPLIGGYKPASCQHRKS
jgi:hypothetical protein